MKGTIKTQDMYNQQGYKKVKRSSKISYRYNENEGVTERKRETIILISFAKVDSVCIILNVLSITSCAQY